MLVQAGAYGIDYFDKLEQIIKGVQPTVNDEKSKELFVEERKKQRQLDDSVRRKQFNAMQRVNHKGNAKNVSGSNSR